MRLNFISNAFKIDSKTFIWTAERKHDHFYLVSLARWLEPEIRGLDHPFRKDFRELSYLTVDPPTWMVSLTFFLTLVLNVIISFWLVSNEYTEEDGHFRQVRWGRRYGYD